MPDNIMRLIQSLLTDTGHVAPFMMMAAGQKIEVNRARIVEGVVIALIAGLIAAASSVYVTVRLLGNDITHLRTSFEMGQAATRSEIRDVKNQVEQIRRDIYRPQL